MHFEVKQGTSCEITLTCHNIFIVPIFCALLGRHKATHAAYDLRSAAKNKKVSSQNFFYFQTVEKVGKKLEALRKKQFSSSGVCDVLYLTLHPNTFVYGGPFFRSLSFLLPYNMNFC